MNEESQKGLQVAADFHENSSDSGKIFTSCDKDMLLPHCGFGVYLFIYLFYWNFILCDTLGVQFLVKFIGNSGH